MKDITEYNELVIFQNCWLESVQHELRHVVDVRGDGEVHRGRLLELAACFEVGHRTLEMRCFSSRGLTT